VYVVTNIGSGSTNWVLTRSDDTDTFGLTSPNTLGEGSTFFVQEGTTGAGETYTCNTVGTITFGTTNITFAQVSSAQIYSAGTGLTLAGTTFSLTNTAVTAATYGTDGAVPQIAVNAQGQITAASNVSINASSISVGTLANGRTTAASANGASTIVARDSDGSFSANVVTAGTGSFTVVSGNGIALTAINASNIASGTIANARTTADTANGASTIVARDANGSFTANVGTFTTISGAGGGLTAINASNISTGTIDNARTTAATANGASTIVLRDASGAFSAGSITGSLFTGNGSALSAINASNVSSGTLSATRGGTGSANLTANNVILGNGAGTVQVVAPGTANNVLTSNGTTWISQASGGGGLTLTDDTSTNASYYPLLTTSTSGSISVANVSSTKLIYNPSTGNLSATIHHSSSDARLKTDITPISDALVKVSQINGVTYIRTDNDQNIRHTGVIAQDVEKVLPEVIAVGVDGYKVVAYGNMIGLLVEAIKELKAEVDALKG
jgi:hypothetical protein